jgi:hypothetical protein
VEDVARELEERRRNGWGPTKKNIAELYDVSIALEVLDGRSNREGWFQRSQEQQG